MKKKFLLIIGSLILVTVFSVLGTFAYLTDTDSAVNTFTIGQVDIVLDEADVDENGKLILDDEGKPVELVKGNEYHLIPGQTYIKDPTITVKAKSEESYIRMIITINCLKELDAIFTPDGADLTSVFDGYNPDLWIYAGNERDEIANTITYEFRYKETVAGGAEDVMLDALFDSFTLPGEITGKELKTLQDLTITVYGHAIQAAGFEDEDDAWAAFDQQVSTRVNP